MEQFSSVVCTCTFYLNGFPVLDSAGKRNIRVPSIMQFWLLLGWNIQRYLTNIANFGQSHIGSSKVGNKIMNGKAWEESLILDFKLWLEVELQMNNCVESRKKITLIYKYLLYI
jgi:hypothetical protein